MSEHDDVISQFYAYLDQAPAALREALKDYEIAIRRRAEPVCHDGTSPAACDACPERERCAVWAEDEDPEVREAEEALKDAIAHDPSFTRDPFGYVLVPMPHHPFANQDGYVHLHRVIVEVSLRTMLPESPLLIPVPGRLEKFLDPSAVVTFEDGNVANVHPRNLRISLYGDALAVRRHLGVNPFALAVRPTQAADSAIEATVTTTEKQ